MELRGLLQYIPKVDKTLKVDGACADAKVVGDEFEAMKKVDEELKKADTELDTKITNAKNDIDTLGKTKTPGTYMHPTAEEHGETGWARFDVTNFMEEKCIGLISVCGNQNRTKLVTFALGRNYTCNMELVVLGASEGVNVILEGNNIKVESTSGGLWGADLSLFRKPSVII